MNKGFLKGVLCGMAAELLVACGAVGIMKAVGEDVFVGKTSSISKTGSIIEDESFKKKYNSIENYVNTYYLNADKLDNDKLSDGIYKGYIDSLDDKYASYYNADEYKALMETSNGQYGGIGAYVSQDTQTGDIVIVNPFEGAPAAKAGIKPGDIIVEIDGTSVAGMDLNDAVTLMKGKEDTEVKVKVYRDKKFVDVTITREIVDVPTVTHQILKDSNIGYIYVSAFDSVTASQFEEALDDIESKNAAGLIVDVRNNGGGMLDVVIQMLDRMLPDGLVMYTETKNGRDQEFYSTDEKSYNKPLAVLINGYSASASEVFTGAIQDFGTGTIVGTTSYGKGVVQTILPLRDVNDGSAIKVTTAKYFTPKGRNIDGTGIDPDVSVEYDPDKTVKNGEDSIDNQLQKAIEVVTEKIKAQ